MPCSNQLSLSGQIIKCYPLYCTPSGVSIARFVLEHKSTQIESGVECATKCKMFCVWVNPALSGLKDGSNVIAKGFISQNAKLQLVLHITELLDKGN